jgi:hypothetical protein
LQDQTYGASISYHIAFKSICDSKQPVVWNNSLLGEPLMSLWVAPEVLRTQIVEWRMFWNRSISRIGMTA